MFCDLTEKLRFDEDPVLKVGDAELTVRSDAEVVLTLMDAVGKAGELDGARKAAELLFSERDQKKLRGLRLKLDDWLAVIKAAMQLAMGVDPAEEETPAGE